jgi:hypothetical protein
VQIEQDKDGPLTSSNNQQVFLPNEASLVLGDTAVPYPIYSLFINLPGIVRQKAITLMYA